MPHLRPNSNSVIAQIMDSIVGEYDADLMLNPCEVENINCRLSSGIESAFVSLTIHQFTRYYQSNGYSPNFQQNFFIPSLNAENTGGFDLSIGIFTNRSRIRTMHKVLYGRRPNRWCDESWIWKIKNTRGKNGEPSGDYRHLGKLVQNYRDSDGIFQPYLILHVCYCVHEYRRMGMVYNETCIPGFNSPLRTIVIDLGVIADNFNQYEWAEIYDSPDFNLIVSKRIPEAVPNESEKDYLIRSARPDLFAVQICSRECQLDIPILSFDQFCAVTLDLVQG